jgi:multisubunit Na+/H+ antiporter MnhC subunit
MKTYTLSGHDESLQVGEANRSLQRDRNAVPSALVITAFTILIAVTTFVARNAETVETHTGHFLARVSH